MNRVSCRCRFVVSGRATGLLLLPVVLLLLPSAGSAATRQRHYYAHDTVEDGHGVIAPWYKGLNGQCDLRVRIAAETLKRYPWTTAASAAAPVPEYVFNGTWSISADGTITVPPLDDWTNGDLGQRASYVLSGLVDYYRYSGDPAAIAQITYQANALLDHCQTGRDHPWPSFLISVPVKGKPYGQADPRGFIQLDIVAEEALGLLRAYQLTGSTRWLEAAKHWADLIAEKRDKTPGADPWGRYANPQDVGWSNKQTGGVAFILYFLDELIRLGYRGEGDSILEARDAGRAYLRDKLLPLWTANDTWGRNYWDWDGPVQQENVTEFACRYMMDHKEHFPNWRSDCRNILALFLNHTSVSPDSNGEVYSGAWAYPESSACCGRSLWYGPMEVAMAFAQYGVEADSEWGREMARRQQILATYDVHETGVSEDCIDGGVIVCGAWFKIAHPMALKHVLGTMAWLPEHLGAGRENHIMRSSAVVNSVIYGDGRVEYTTFDAPANTVDVLRLAFRPRSVIAGGRPLSLRRDLKSSGYTLKKLRNGDYIVTIRHDGRQDVVVTGDDPQQVADDAALTYGGEWSTVASSRDLGGACRVATASGAEMRFGFRGNQVRLIGRADEAGGRADVYLDGAKQLVGIDCWNPAARHQQVLYYRNGLQDGAHTIRVVARGEKNPYSKDTGVYIDAVQWSDAAGDAGYGSGGGPKGIQRFVLGYAGRQDIRDSSGGYWRPGAEVVTRLGSGEDSVLRTWWTTPSDAQVSGTPDPELYRYGMHHGNFVVNFTVGPGKYYARLRFAASDRLDPKNNRVNVSINGHRLLIDTDISDLAGGINKAFDVVLNGIKPRNGVIAVRFTGSPASDGPGEAFVQAVEIGPGKASRGVSDMLTQQMPATLPPSLTGVVKGDGRPVQGAIVQSADGGLKAATGPDGSFALAAPDGPHELRASERGYYPQRRTVQVSGSAVCSFDLVPIKGNLLTNAGFDDGWPDGWQFETKGAGMVRAGHTPAIWAPYPVFYHTGQEDTEILSNGPAGGEGRITQTVPVTPGGEYTASAWFRGYGPSWGKDPRQKAGLFVQELDKDGKLVADHPVVWAERFDDWTKLTTNVTTGLGTAAIRVGGYAFLVDDYNQTTYRALFDTFELIGKPPSLTTDAAK